MQTEDKATPRFSRRFGLERPHPAALVANCVAGRIIVLGIVLIGVSVPSENEANLAATAGPSNGP